jgi:hypothetical protein
VFLRPLLDDISRFLLSVFQRLKEKLTGLGQLRR